MNERKRHLLVWNVLCLLIAPVLRLLFCFRYQVNHPGQPVLVVSNHVTNFDPMLVAITFPKHQMYFVASEHLFRKGWLSKALHYLVAPIARRKGTTGMDTAMACVRKLRAGQSVCIFGEGETTWNGLTSPIFPATGNLARISGAALVTYRLEGGFLTAPRWGKGIRRGRMAGRVVNTYQPEELKKLTAEQINEIINRDIYEDTWAEQKRELIAYRGENRAEQIETSLFMCPKCHRIGTVHGRGNRVQCACGLNVEYTEYGFFDPPQPFENMAQWDQWQHEMLRGMEWPSFSDEGVSLFKLHNDHTTEALGSGVLKLEGHVLYHGEDAFPLCDITDLGLVQRRILVFTYEGEYYELRADRPICLRKYFAAWRNCRQQMAAEK